MAEISPELAEKIRELSARYEENPGRFFVPLANAYRDAGEIGQAEDLLRSGLKRYTGYLSAHIVLGRCLADRGAVEEAAHEFRYVLSVDPQNLIALRTLGEMAGAQGRPAEAARWYRELLAVDPMNKEAQSALEALGPAADAPPAASAPSAPAEHAPGYGDLSADFGLVDIDAGGGHADAPAPAEFGMVEPGAANELPMPQAPDAGHLSDFGVVDLAPHAPEAAAPKPASAEPAGPPIDFGGWGEVSLDNDAAASAEPKADDRMREYDTFSFGDVELGSGAAAAGAAPEAPQAAPADAFGPPPLDAGFGFDATQHDEDEEVVTETMAELYARQGFHDRAIDVYRELIRRRGDEPALVRRLAELETLAAKEAATGVESSVIEPPTLDTAALLEPEENVELPVIETGLPGLNFSAGADLPFEPVDASFGNESSAGAPSADTGAAAGFAVDEGLSFGTVDFGGAPEQAPAANAEQPGYSFDAPSAGDWGVGGMADDATLPFPSAPAVPEAGFVADVENDAPAAPAFEDATPAPAFEAAAPTAGASAELTGDAFADSFAYGFGDAAPESASAAAPQAEAPQAASADSFASAETQPSFDAAPPSFDAPSQPVAEVPSFEAPSQPIAEAPSFDPAPSAEAPQPTPAPQAAQAPRTVTSYLSSLLNWRPGQASAEPAATQHPIDQPPAAQAPVEPSASTETPSTETAAFGAPAAETPSSDQPSAEAPSFDAPAFEAPAADTPSFDQQSAEAHAVEQPAAEAQPESTAEEMPWDAPQAEAPAEEPAADLPWLDTPAAEQPSAPAAEEPAPWEAAPWDAPAAEQQPEAEQPEAPQSDAAQPEPFEISSLGFDLPPQQAGEPMVQGGAEEPLPWELGSPEAPPPPAPVPEAPRQPPTPPEGGFSFEDFFSAPPAEPEPAPAPPAAHEPAPAQEPAAPPAAQPGGEDDEDLESFQAWLQSLKR